MLSTVNRVHTIEFFNSIASFPLHRRVGPHNFERGTRIDLHLGQTRSNGNRSETFGAIRLAEC
jgi:hypothetical protein